MSDRSSRQQLVEFLRSRRLKLTPASVGLPAGARRRVPGLRREEVAQLAGVSLVWYTSFEQGRDINVSTAFLEAVSKALHLDKTERAHLFGLAQHRPPPYTADYAFTCSSELKRTVDAIQSPSYVRTLAWDLVYWNKPASLFFSVFDGLADNDRNFLKVIFLNEQFRSQIRDWDGYCRYVVARFRVDYTAAQGEAAFEAVVAELLEASPKFQQLWSSHDVRLSTEGVRIYSIPSIGDIAMERCSLMETNGSQLRVVVHVPLPGTDSEKLERLMQGR